MRITDLSMRGLLVFVLIVTGLLISMPSWGKGVGPYSGRVVDSQTGEPVAGATVLFYWMKAKPHFYAGTLVNFTVLPCQIALVSSDDEGNYKVPRQTCKTGLTSFLYFTKVIIYQPGYFFYEKNEIHKIPFAPYPRKETSFKRKGNQVRLERIPPLFDHQKHYENILHALSSLEEYETVVLDPLKPEATTRITGPIPELRQFLQHIEWEKERIIPKTLVWDKKRRR